MYNKTIMRKNRFSMGFYDYMEVCFMADNKTDMLPICLPVLPLRGVVMFPQTILNLM